MGIEVAITNLEGDAAGQLLVFAQVEGQRVDHADEGTTEHIHIDSILLEGVFLGHGFLFTKRYDQRIVQPIGFAPDVDPILPENFLHREHLHLL
ncbi:hypothetical protein D3C80_1673380 [compost metagenome]